MAQPALTLPEQLQKNHPKVDFLYAEGALLITNFLLFNQAA